MRRSARIFLALVLQIVPRHVLTIENDLLLFIRAKGDGLGPCTALGDLDVCARPVDTSTEIDDIARSGSVDGRLDGTKWCRGRTSSRASRGDINLSGTARDG